jgi:hypothetical protein
MHRARERETEQTLKLTLSRGGAQKIGTPDNICDAIGCVINHDCEVVGPCTISPPQDEIADLLGDILHDSPGSPIFKLLRSFFNL